MSELLDLLSRSAGILALAALVLATVALAAALRARPPREPSVRRREPAPIPGDALMHEVVAEHEQRIGSVDRELELLDRRAGALEEAGRVAVQRVGLVRYNPFEDTGSNQSFALALLDARGDGIILSSLHSRQATRLYLKRIQNGGSDAPLSAEEAQAVREAR